ncbi:DNA alkylation repair protein [Rhodoferax sp.]|uniref:DNA alkylation repair protein n=1 Tax=Rhodoferax sp. TaxID=50421 RepID=UPI0026227D67|nr:DNA alkylation repair protein [Rhodoferax sp.]MDD2809041.1 DNA alkylation repair protein [Rhodoferax sp.]MDD4943338.1 DNA alkylation repair protein [Rhodoferax sp.]
MSRLRFAIKLLEQHARPDQLAGMARFGINPERRLGLSMPAIRALAKILGHDHELASALWSTGIPDAQIVAGMVAEPAKLTAQKMDEWVACFQSWDVCDQVCGSAFKASPLAWSKVAEWAPRDEEFVRRAAFALLATLAVHDKKADDEHFLAALALVEHASGDERNFVKKAVNWALRNIGKRNPALNAAAVDAAHRIQHQETRPARWIAADALRELTSEAVQTRVQHRSISSPKV